MNGLVYPLSAIGGTLELTNKYPELVRNAILSGLYTRLEERVMRPEYGLDPQEFQSVSAVTDILSVVRSAIALALEGYPDVSFDLRGAINEDGKLDVLVIYSVDEETLERLEVTI